MVNLIKVSKQTYINPDNIISVFKELDTEGKTVYLAIDFGSDDRVLTLKDREAIDFAESVLGIG